MVCADKRKVWVDVIGHKRRVLKCVNKPKKRTEPKKLKVRLPGIVKRWARPIATPPRSPPLHRRRIHISPPRATPPRFSATPPSEPTATPPRRSPPRRAHRRELRVALERQTFRKPHKKISRVEPTYDE